MTVKDWDSLIEETEKIEGDLSDIGFMIEFAKIWNQVKKKGHELQEKAEKYDKLVKLTPSPKLIEYSQKIVKIREILEKPQYMDEAVLLKMKILEILDI
uniref:Uncharacterized protein n=1 Tax=viral metagenome TaxID=1070528 RepID=A0A6M3M9M7_9ZZZZ